MGDRFDKLVRALRDYDIAVDEPYLHGLITSAALIPDPDTTGILAAIAGDQPVAEVVLDTMLDSIDGVIEELETFVYQARFDAASEESAQSWISGFVDAVGIHDETWEELTETRFDAGMILIAFQHLQNPALLEDLSQDLDLPTAEDLKQHPQLITNAVLAAHAALQRDTDDEFALPHYSEPELGACDELMLMGIVTSDGDLLPREVVDECARRADAMVPVLRRHLEDDANWDAGADDDDWWGLLHAILILGLIPGQAAAEALLVGFRRANFDDEGHLSDWLSSAWPALCRNKTAFTTGALREIAEDSAAPWYARCQAVDCVLAEAEEAGSDALEESIDWLAAMCADSRDDPEFRVIAGHNLLDYPRERHRRVMAELVKLQLPGTSVEMAFGEADIEQSFDTGDDPDWHRSDDPWQFYDPKEIVRRQERWLQEDEEAQAAFEGDYLDRPEPFVRVQRKIGRNEPCPCGSGLKYKNCCMRSQR